MHTDNYTTQQSSSTGSRLSRRAPGRRITWRLGLSAATVALLAGATTACEGHNSAAGDSGASSSHTGTNDSSPAGSHGSGSGSDGNSATEPNGTETPAQTGGKTASDRCTAQKLGIKLGPGDPGAGNIRFPLTLTNTGSKSCALQGFPGVSLLAGDGRIIGKPAQHEGGPTGSVRLAPGQSAQAVLHTVNKGVKDGPCWDEPRLLRVYPPGSKDAMTLRTKSPHVCGDTFTVTSLQ